MYELADLISAVRRPRRTLIELNCLYHSRFFQNPYYTKGIDVIENEDWDNLLILDACRYDEFANRESLPGKTQLRCSRGAITSEFLKGNFSGRHLHDTVYISANPWYLRLRESIDSSVYRFIDLQERCPTCEYTVPPKKTTVEAKSIAREYPNKRLIVHYLQPHQPYLGTTNQDYFETTSGLAWTIRETKNASRAKLREAYRENLDLALNAVEDLVDHLYGKTVITADHGELLGERCRPIPVRTYGHFAGLWVDNLINVPWQIVSNAERKEIIPEEPEDAKVVSQEEVDERLHDLGYRL